MDEGYNLYNLEASFKQWLGAGKKFNARNGRDRSLQNNSIKNYLSDFRHFVGWLTFYWKSNNKCVILNSFQDLIEMLKQVQHDTMEDYKSYLISNNIPLKTINRRLSTVRKFCSFCISQGWMKENPAKKVENVKHTDSTEKKQIPQILTEFEKDLLKEGFEQNSVNSHLTDVREFLGLL